MIGLQIFARQCFHNFQNFPCYYSISFQVSKLLIILEIKTDVVWALITNGRSYSKIDQWKSIEYSNFNTEY